MILFMQSYASKISLIGHEFTHTGNYPFACEQCPKVCSSLICLNNIKCAKLFCSPSFNMCSLFRYWQV